MAPVTRYVVPYARIGSTFGPAEQDAVNQVLNGAPTLTSGVWRSRFEEAFRQYVGTRHAMTVTSGTVSLMLAIHLLDLRPGDRVITTAQTYQATVQPLLDYHVDVAFCDVDPVTLNIDPEQLVRHIGARTKAVILVHYGGLPANMEQITDIARSHGILVVEDSAHALGAEYHGRRPGGLADIGCFSFHSTKNITTLGEGGMITFSRDDWRDRLERIRSNEVDGQFFPRDGGTGSLLGPRPKVLPWMRDVGAAYTHDCRDVRLAGTNAVMCEASAAVGLTQLHRLDELVERRRAVAARLDEVLEPVDGITLQRSDDPAVAHAYHFYTFFMSGRDGYDRDALVVDLDRAGVEIQLRYFPLHLRPEWRMHGHGRGDCPRLERQWFETQVNLPCHPGLTDSQVDHMVAALNDRVASRSGRRRAAAYIYD